MWIRRLSLTNFRNYRSQELDLPRGSSLILGENAQGKTNLLEAAFLLATTRSERAGTDGELICWDALSEAQPVARVAGQIERADGPLELEVIVVGRPREGGGAERVPASKRLRVNGVPKRAADMVGQLTAVLFTTDDMALISGAPAERRRYLDVMLCQLEPPYLRATQQYAKVVTQRNALLKRIHEGEAQAGELDFWDDELAREGATIVEQRALAAGTLAGHARDAHRRLSGETEELAIAYQPRVDGWDASLASDASAIAEALRGALESGRRRDVGAGMTLTGPHRDDLSVALDGVAASSFASRGQQRTAALALRLAEARLMAERKGELPVVLLDDVLSELDEARRRAVLESLGDWDQLLITSTDGDRFGEGLAAAAVYHVVAGSIQAE
jgi:DNA replication and repair protein RecF